MCSSLRDRRLGRMLEQLRPGSPRLFSGNAEVPPGSEPRPADPQKRETPRNAGRWRMSDTGRKGAKSRLAEPIGYGYANVRAYAHIATTRHHAPRRPPREVQIGRHVERARSRRSGPGKDSSAASGSVISMVSFSTLGKEMRGCASACLALLVGLFAAGNVPARAAWGPRTEIATFQAREVSRPLLAADDAGDVVAVWTRDPGSRVELLEAAVRTLGGAWSPPVRLASVRGIATVSQPTVGADDEATVVWGAETRSGKRLLQTVDVRSYRPGAGWGPATRLASHSGPVPINLGGFPVPQVALGRERAPLVAFALKRPRGAEYVQVTRRGRNRRWSAPRVVARTAYCNELVVRRDGRGETLLAWSRHDESAPLAGWIETLILNGRGARESPPFIVSGPEAEGIGLATNAAGDAVITWNKVLPDGEGEGPLLVRSRPAAGAFGRRYRLATKAYPAKVAVTPSGESTVLFDREIYTGPIGLSEPVLEVEAVSQVGKGPWTRPRRLSSGEGWKPSIGSAADGETIALWNAPEPKTRTTTHLVAASRPAGGSWQALPAFSGGPVRSEDPVTVAVSDGGRATAAWAEPSASDRSSETSIEAVDYSP